MMFNVVKLLCFQDFLFDCHKAMLRSNIWAEHWAAWRRMGYVPPGWRIHTSVEL